jgi:hypothetical protein
MSAGGSAASSTVMPIVGQVWHVDLQAARAVGALLMISALAWSCSSTRSDPSAEEVASRVVHDFKFSGRSIERARTEGDAILEPLRRETADFTVADFGAPLRVVEVLSQNRSKACDELLLELFRRDRVPARLIGAAGLAAHGKLPAEGEAWLLNVAANRLTDVERRGASLNVLVTYRELAIKALSDLESKASVPVLIGIVGDDSQDPALHRAACRALGRIGDAAATDPLRDAMKRRDFQAVPAAFLALVALGDTMSVGLAIDRVDPDLERYTGGSLVPELERITGMKYGADRAAWRAWWEKARPTWVVPRRFLSPAIGSAHA